MDDDDGLHERKPEKGEKKEKPSRVEIFSNSGPRKISLDVLSTLILNPYRDEKSQKKLTWRETEGQLARGSSSSSMIRSEICLLKSLKNKSSSVSPAATSIEPKLRSLFKCVYLQTKGVFILFCVLKKGLSLLFLF